MNAGSNPYVTTVGLARSLNSTPLQHARVVDELRRRQESTTGFNPWSKLCGAIRADLRFGTDGVHLARAVREAPTRFPVHYQELATGWARYLRSRGGAAGWGLAKVSDAVVARGQLTIKLNPQVGISFPDDHVEATYLWFDQEPLPEQTALVLLHLMQVNMDAICPGAVACIVDLRRSQAHYLPVAWGRGRAVERYLDGHAAAIVALWRAAAA